MRLLWIVEIFGIAVGYTSENISFVKDDVNVNGVNPVKLE